MFEKFFRKKSNETPSELIEENEKYLERREKERKAEELLYLLMDIINELLYESQNALILASKNRINGVWDGYVEDLIQGKSPIFYIDNAGITRMGYTDNKLNIVHSGEAPSKIKGKTIQVLWDEIEDKYQSQKVIHWFYQ